MTGVLILHLFVMGLAMFFASLGVKKNMRVSKSRLVMNAGYTAAFLLLFFFLASRVNLGRDWNNYMDLYRDCESTPFSFSESFEFGFLFIMKFLKSLDADFQWFIIITSFITVTLFFRAFRKIYCLLPFGILIFFTQWAYPVVINTIRQGIAILAFLCAFSYVGESGPKALLKYLAFILIGVLFHYTILLFIPVYWLGKMQVNLKQLLLITGAAYVLSFFLIMPLFNDVLALFSKYTYSMDSYYSNSATFGFGAMTVLIARLLPLVIFPYIKKKYPSFVKYYLLYYIGVAVNYAFLKYLMIVRVTFYLQFFELVLMPLLLFLALRKKKKYGIYAVAFLVFSFIYYFYTFRSFIVDQAVSTDYSVMLMNFSTRGI